MRQMAIRTFLALAATLCVPLMSHPMPAYAQITAPDGGYLTPEAQAFVYDAYFKPCYAWLQQYTFTPPSGNLLLTGTLDQTAVSSFRLSGHKTDDPIRDVMSPLVGYCLANPNQPILDAETATW